MSVVVGVGVPTLDRLVAVPRPPEIDTSLLVESRGAQGGGQVATALVAARRLGHAAALVASVGEDADGALVLAELRDELVDTTCVRVVPGGRTAASIVLVAPDGRRTILYDAGASIDPLLDPEALALLARADGIALAGTHPFSFAAACAPRRDRAVVLLDLDAFDRDEDELVSRCDVVIASAAYATSRGLAPGAAAHSLVRMGATTAIVTCGVEGAVGLSGGREHVEPAHPVEAVDTTGAGDVYHGAYLVAALEGLPLDRAMRFAAVVAGLKCRRPGGRAGIPARDEVDAAL